jgi:methylated-DNA-[protein]-cysteine S-methyltransferase
VSARVEVATFRLRSAIGSIWILASARGLREIRLGEGERPSGREAKRSGVRFVRRPRWTETARRALERYFKGMERDLDLPLDLARGTPFERRVWEEARRIRYGTLASYGDLAARIGAPRAARAVGNALGVNPVPIVIPCHRVIHGDRSLGGFSSGLAWKRYLLGIERGQLELELTARRRGGRLWRHA